MSESSRLFRPIRSFVRREGRLTKGQSRALQELWPRFGLQPGEAIVDYIVEFDCEAPTIVEIGFGNGEAFATMAEAHPANNYIGIEVHRPGVGNLLLQLQQRDIQNVRIICEDASDILKKNIADQSLDAVYLFFPDPWPKRKHHKRRLVQPDFVQRLRRTLKIGGVFHLATDWQEYAQHMLQVMAAADGYTNVAGVGAYSPKPDYRPQTRFERRGLKLGHGVWDLVFHRQH